MLEMKYILKAHKEKKNPADYSTKVLNESSLKEVYKFHKTIPGYEPTPLHDLTCLSEHLGIGKLLVKDESLRFGLNAFKVLGGSYAIAKYISQRLAIEASDFSFKTITSEEVKKAIGDVVFVTATDGNHGRGVAWAANQLGQKSVVFMPKGSSEVRLENIRKEGAQASILDMNYDDAVRFATKYAEEHNGILVQDTAWDGYDTIPTWILQGYTTLTQEAIEQMELMGLDKPTHIFLQAGVGSFASSVLGCFVEVFRNEKPICGILEPNQADCIYKSAKIGDGKPHAVTGDLTTIMAGLACGEPSTISWEILRDYSEAFVSCSDEVAASGMRILGKPLGNDPVIVSGESGAVGAGFMRAVMEDEAYLDLRDHLGLNEDSVVLIISTEGDTDPESYMKIMKETAIEQRA